MRPRVGRQTGFTLRQTPHTNDLQFHNLRTYHPKMCGPATLRATNNRLSPRWTFHVIAQKTALFPSFSRTRKFTPYSMHAAWRKDIMQSRLKIGLQKGNFPWKQLWLCTTSNMYTPPSAGAQCILQNYQTVETKSGRSPSLLFHHDWVICIQKVVFPERLICRKQVFW